VRQSFNTTMTPVYTCPVHGSCISAKTCNGIRRHPDITSRCSVYATPPYNGPRRAGATRRQVMSVHCRHGDRCRARHVACTSSPHTGRCCLAAARRQADSVDALLPFVSALDVVAGEDLASTNYGLGRQDDCTAAEKTADVDGVFYTANSQHPDALISSASWTRDRDRQLDEHRTTSSTQLDDNGHRQLPSADHDRGQPTLLVDFHC